MKKIIQVISSSHTGGGQTHLINLLQNINREDFKIITIADTNGHYSKDFTKYSDDIYFIDFNKNLFLVFYKIIKVIKKEKPDIIHNHLLRACLISGFAGLIMRVRMIINNLHGGIDDDLSSGKLKVKLYYVLYRRLSRFGIINLCVSKSNMDKLQMRNVLGRFAVIYNGSKDFFSEEINFANNYPITNVLTIARLHPAKGIETIISASQLVKKKCNFQVIGDGPLFTQLNERVSELKIKNIQLLGFKKNVKDYLESADIFVLPSNWEAFPVAVVEAMSASLPIISTNVGGVSEVVENGIGGYIVDIGDSALIADKIDYLADHPEKRSIMGHNNRRVYEELLTYDRMINNYENLYNNDFSLYTYI